MRLGALLLVSLLRLDILAHACFAVRYDDRFFNFTFNFQDYANLNAVSDDDDDEANSDLKVAEENEFPYQVIVMTMEDNKKPTKFCGGVIVAKSWVLTAAHCIEKADYGYVAGGSSDIRSIHMLPAQKFVLHENYSSKGRNGKYVNDIGLIETAMEIPLDGKTAVVATLPSSEVDVPHPNALAVGWEWYKDPNPKEGGSFPVASALRKLEVLSFRCGENLCARAKGFLGRCMGEVGGPLYIHKTVYGISSYHINLDPGGDNAICAGVLTFNVFMYIPNYVQWINTTIETIS